MKTTEPKIENAPAEKPLEFFVTTSDFNWGKGLTIDDALKNAYFSVRLDWVNVFIGYDLCPGSFCSAEGDIVASFKLNLGNYRRK